VSERRFALVAGGGTAGHLQPALAVADALVARGHRPSTIEFVGSRRGQDRRVLAGRPYPFTLLPGRGVQRSLTPRALARNAGALAGIVWATVRAVVVVASRRPSVVVSVGGYAAVPASVAAVLLRVPLVLVNVDAVPGAANRLLGRFARAAAVGWEGTPLPRGVVTGTPVRPAILGVDRSADGRVAARRALGLPASGAVVAAFGGSLGARSINQAVVSLATRWDGRDGPCIYHVVGRRDFAASPPHPRPGYLPVAYEERMELVYAAADVVVCRAGAMTVAELAVAGVPAVLVPLPGAPGDHQTANARVLERAGAAVVVPDRSCTAEELDRILAELIGDPGRLAAMGAAARSVGRPDAADAGAQVVERFARPDRAHGVAAA
jgi:undecaprenyldiphospho-muramoylpentapeptide beta-N-acetylglucosaminyltransferase